MAKKILIAEDEPNIVISLEFLLKEASYEIAVARDGSEAIRLVVALRPDLLVLDLMLPSVNGFEVCRWIRSNPGTQDIKIVMLTARGQEREIKKGLELGANAYLTKPFATRELIETVNRLLGA